MERRIAPPGSPDLLALLDSLVIADGSGGEAIFRSKQKALMFAASLGWHIRQRRALEKKGEPIRYTIFEGALDDGFVNALAVAETQDLQVLHPDREDERISIFEEYAHAGFCELQRLLALPGNRLDQVLQVIMDARAPEAAPEGVAPDLARMFGA